MIRGAIETASRTVISGWLYARAVDLRGQLVLAFIGNRHVGTGKIELFRKDILDAGLGDGYSGFHFPVELEPSDDPQSLTIRLEQSDLNLLQPEALVVPATLVQKPATAKPSTRPAAARAAKATTGR